MDEFDSYMAVGARSVEDQQHRFVASGADLRLGLKIQPLEISMLCLMEFMLLKNKQSFPFPRKRSGTTGNPLSHAILRGAINEYGKNIPKLTTMII